MLTQGHRDDIWQSYSITRWQFILYWFSLTPNIIASVAIKSIIPQYEYSLYPLLLRGYFFVAALLEHYKLKAATVEARGVCQNRYKYFSGF
ncbi:hypothetical protein BST81_10795 [Leptolyngbya sp. 'hensonii']|nr:hypothetical protein BST81_10795 [Leptolyngbya sp. 'hensonii']